MGERVLLYASRAILTCVRNEEIQPRASPAKLSSSSPHAFQACEVHYHKLSRHDRSIPCIIASRDRFYSCFTFLLTASSDENLSACQMEGFRSF